MGYCRAEAEARGKAELVALLRTIKGLREDVFSRQRRNEGLESELAWAREKNSRLEEALQSATLEIKLRSEANARLEFKAGDQAQARADLERVRKTLTAQLFDLRQETGPNEQLLASTAARLRELEREYEHGLHAMADKDAQLAARAAAVQTLQAQNRELRAGVGHREQVLGRAAAQLTEYTRSLELARVNAVKRTVTREREGVAVQCLEELIVCGEDMGVALARLGEVLGPYSASEEDLKAHQV